MDWNFAGIEFAEALRIARASSAAEKDGLMR